MATRVLVPGAGGFNSEDTGQPLAAAPSGDGQTAAWTDRRGRSRRCDVVGALTDGGRRPKITAEQKKEIVEAVVSGRKTSAEIARLFKIHPATVSRVLAQARIAV